MDKEAVDKDRQPWWKSTPPAAPPGFAQQPAAFSIEALIHDCIPGGSVCDPQAVADNIRHWVAQQPAAQAAVRTLEQKGYTYHGGELWKPPIGKPPRFITEDAAAQAAGLMDGDCGTLHIAIDLAESMGNAALADGLRSLLSRAAPSGEAVAYVECRECGRCGHTGINDAHSQDECCSNCDWTGPAPKEDVCPGCAQTGTMRAACPKCGSVYRLLCETTVGTAPQPSVQEAEQRDYRKELAEALGRPDGLRGGKPIGLAWELLIGYVKDMREYAERVERQAEQPAEEARGVDEALKALKRLIEAVEDAHSDLFGQCASNPIRNAWGEEVSVAKLNEAAALALSLRALLASLAATKEPK